MGHAAHKHKNGKKRAGSAAAATAPAACPSEEPGIGAQAASGDRPPCVDDQAYQGVARDIAQLIQKHPIPALVLGVGLGFVFTRLLRS
jgi:hypothetical protein